MAVGLCVLGVLVCVRLCAVLASPFEPGVGGGGLLSMFRGN